MVSRNENGTSLPSAILTLNMSAAAWNGVSVKGRKIFSFFAQLVFMSGNYQIFHVSTIFDNEQFKFCLSLSPSYSTTILLRAAGEEETVPWELPRTFYDIIVPHQHHNFTK